MLHIDSICLIRARCIQFRLPKFRIFYRCACPTISVFRYSRGTYFTLILSSEIRRALNRSIWLYPTSLYQVSAPLLSDVLYCLSMSHSVFKLVCRCTMDKTTCVSARSCSYKCPFSFFGTTQVRTYEVIVPELLTHNAWVPRLSVETNFACAVLLCWWVKYCSDVNFYTDVTVHYTHALIIHYAVAHWCDDETT